MKTTIWSLLLTKKTLNEGNTLPLRMEENLSALQNNTTQCVKRLLRVLHCSYIAEACSQAIISHYQHAVLDISYTH